MRMEGGAMTQAEQRDEDRQPNRTDRADAFDEGLVEEIWDRR